MLYKVRGPVPAASRSEAEACTSTNNLYFQITHHQHLPISEAYNILDGAFDDQLLMVMMADG
jgi:hypothetical protein